MVECSTQYAAIPDNQGRDNPASHELVRVIDKARQDMKDFMNAEDGQFFTGESGTELLFRIISNACLGAGKGGVVLGSTCLLYTSPSPRDQRGSRMPSSA